MSMLRSLSLSMPQISPDMSEPSSLWSPLYFMHVLYVRSRSFVSQQNKLIMYMLFYLYIYNRVRNMAFLSGEDESLLWEVMFESTLNGPQKCHYPVLVALKPRV